MRRRFALSRIAIGLVLTLSASSAMPPTTRALFEQDWVITMEWFTWAASGIPPIREVENGCEPQAGVKVVEWGDSKVHKVKVRWALQPESFDGGGPWWWFDMNARYRTGWYANEVRDDPTASHFFAYAIGPNLPEHFFKDPNFPMVGPASLSVPHASEDLYLWAEARADIASFWARDQVLVLPLFSVNCEGFWEPQPSVEYNFEM